MRFYVLNAPKPDSPADFAGRLDAMQAEDSNIGDAPRCSQCGTVLGMCKLLPPYRIELEVWGRHYGDIAPTGDELIVSERFTRMFQDEQLKGLSGFEPVEIVKIVHRRGKPHEPLPRYFITTVTFSPTTIDQAASGYVWKDAASVCSVCLFDTMWRYERLVIKEDTWNGDDIFYPRGGRSLIVSERFKTACEKNAILSVAFTDPAHESHDGFPWETEKLKKGLGGTTS